MEELSPIPELEFKNENENINDLRWRIMHCVSKASG
jgi:hypothetical protein